MKTAQIAKITRPKLSGTVKRDRLFHLLDQGKQKPVVWITAQGGSGKTTLVADWLDSRQLPCLWYQVDEGDADIASFFYYMGMAAKHAAPRYKKPLPVLTPEYLQGIPVFTRRYFEALFSRLNPPAPPFVKGGKNNISGFDTNSSPPFSKGGQGGFVVVLDNYQDAPLASGFHDMIAHGLDTIPEGITVIILSRSTPPPQLARLQANNKLHAIGWDDVRFTREESLGLLETQNQGKLSADAREVLYDKTEGWAAGLILLAGADTDAPAGMTAGKLFDYFASEIFNKTEAPVQDILLKTSFLQKITPVLAEKLSGNAKAGAILERMRRENYFTQDYGRVYQYHPLFREFLRSRAQSSLSPADIIVVQRKAAELLERYGDAQEAAGLYIAAGDWSNAERVILAQAPALMSQGRCGIFEEWLGNFPQARIAVSPWMLYWLGTCRMAYNPVEARSYLEKAFTRFEHDADISGLFISWASIIDTFVYEWSDFQPLDRWIAAAEKLMTDHPLFPSPEIEARVVSGMFSALFWRQPQNPALHNWAERLSLIVLGDGDYPMRIALGNNLYQFHTWMGDFSKAALLFDVLHKASRLQSAPPLAMQWWCGLEAMHSWFSGDHEACLAAISRGVALGEKSGVHLLDFFLFGQGVCSGLTLGHPEAAEEFLGRIEKLNTPRNIDKSLFHYTTGSVLWYRGQWPESVEHCKQAVRFSANAGCPYTEALCRLELAVTLFDLGRQADAESELAHALTLSLGLTHMEFVCRVYGAWFAFAQGGESRGVSELRQAFTIGARQQYINFSRWQPAMMSRLCARALEHHIEPDYVKKLIRVRSLIPEGDVANWPYPVRVQTLGRFEILKDGQPVTFAGKVQKKPIELLKALIALGGKEIPEGRLIDALWPDSEGDAGRSTLKSTLLRLRQLLGSDEMVSLGGGAVTLNRSLCYVDAFAFEHAMQEIIPGADNRQGRAVPGLVAAASITTNHTADAGAITAKAAPTQIDAAKIFGLYRGRFLPADTAFVWTNSFRERLQSKFLRFSLKVGGAMEEQGRWTEAIEHYLRVLEADDLHEEFYQRLMFCHLSLGQQAEAASTYQRCKRALLKTFGAPLSDLTETLNQAALERKI